MLFTYLLPVVALVSAAAAAPLNTLPVEPAATVRLAKRAPLNTLPAEPAATAGFAKRDELSSTEQDAETELVKLIEGVNTAVANSSSSCYTEASTFSTAFNGCKDLSDTAAEVCSCICQDSVLLDMTTASNCLGLTDPSGDISTLCANSNWLAAVGTNSTLTDNVVETGAALASFALPGLAAALVAGLAAVAL